MSAFRVALSGDFRKADGSPTLQEAFMTAIRVRLADRRARAFLQQSLKAKRGQGVAPKAPPGPAHGH